MEEPDLGKNDSPKMTFKAIDNSPSMADTNKKEARKSVGERLKMRKSTPRHIMKGVGKKRYNLSPSPEAKPALKSVFTVEDAREDNSEVKNKRNLLKELDKAGDTDGEVAISTSKEVENSQQEESKIDTRVDMTSPERGSSNSPREEGKEGDGSGDISLLEGEIKELKIMQEKVSHPPEKESSLAEKESHLPETTSQLLGTEIHCSMRTRWRYKYRRPWFWQILQ